MKKEIIKLEPYIADKIWGWEKWVLSCHKEGNSIVANGAGEGQPLSKVLGCNDNFPVLTKVIKANDTLSVQVHPDDEYAGAHENSRGKTECWYILEATEDATLISGIEDNLNREKMEAYIKKGELESCLKRIKVRAGDFIYIPAGTVHAIEGGLKLIEVQQNSNVTYRLYDWGRGRETHIQKSLDVIDYKGENKGGKIENFTRLETPYFSVEKVSVKNDYEDKVSSDFHSYTVIEGVGIIKTAEQKIELRAEGTIYIPSGIPYRIEGDISLIKVIV